MNNKPRCRCSVILSAPRATPSMSTALPISAAAEKAFLAELRAPPPPSFAAAPRAAASPSAKLGAVHVKQVLTESLGALAAADVRRTEAARLAAALPDDDDASLSAFAALDGAQIDGALGSLAARGAALEAELRALGDDDARWRQSRLPALAATFAELEGLHGELGRAEADGGERAALARDVSGRVGALHGAQARVADTLAALDRLADVEQSADVVAAAVAGADYETAVAHVAKLRAAGALGGGGGEGAAATSPGRKDLRSVHAELSAQVRAELERAVAAADGAAVVRFAALLPPLGLSDAAAAAFTTWCDAQLAAAAAADGAAGASAQQRLGAVLQRAGALCASAATVFEGKGGGGGAEGRAARVQLVLSIRDKSIELASSLTSEYIAASRLGARTAAAAAARRPAATIGVGGAAAAEMEAEAERAGLECGNAADELVAVLRGAALYDRYIRDQTGESALPPPPAGEATTLAERVAAAGAAAAGGSLREAPPLLELERAAIVVGAFHASAAVARAMRDARAADGAAAATDDEKDAAAHAMVDTTFFVLQRALRRGAHAADAKVAGAAVRHAAELVQRPLLDHLQKLLKQSVSSKLAGAALAGAQEGAAALVGASAAAGASLAGAAERLAASAVTQARQAGALRALNTLAQCATNLPKLWERARAELAQQLPPPAAAAALRDVDAAAAVDGAVGAALQGGLQQLSEMVLPRLKPRIDAFAAASYVLDGDDAAFAAAEADSFVSPLLDELALQKRLFADNGLAPENVEALLLLLLRACAERIEAALLDKDFDRLGALQLDREMRALAKRGAELCNRSVRDRLARLTQLCTILNLDREAELAELWGDGSGWRISGAVASDVARLRVDFREELIPELAS